jgi:K+-transporting ATPase KdpF subunit
MDLFTWTALICSILLLAYLVGTMLFPEKF